MLTLLLAAALSVPSFARPATPRQPEPSSDLSRATPLDRLESLAAEQRDHPDADAVQAPDPPGSDAVKAQGVAPADLDRPEAREPLESVLDRHAALVLDPAPESVPPGPSDDDVFAATRLYVQARQKLLDDDSAGALIDLTNAVALDPGAPSLWLTLGEARLQTGQEEQGIEAMRRAVALGLEHPRPLLLVSTWETSHGQHEAAIHHGARAVRALGPRDDPAIERMVWASLGDALAAGGYVWASARAYTLGFDLPAQFTSGTAYTGEVSSMYRSAWDALFRAGTLAIAVSDWETAARAFSTASRFRAIDEARALPPRVLAEMRLGHPAQAGLAIIEAIQTRGLASDERTHRLIGYLRDHSQVGPMLAAALTNLENAVRGKSPAMEGATARAVAAGLPDGLGRGPLAEALARHPGQLEVARDLLGSFGPGELDTALDTASRFAGEQPVFSQTIADAMIATGLRTRAVLDGLRARASQPGASLLLARLLIESGGFEEAREILARPTPDADAQLAAARRLLAVSLESSAGDREAARRLIDAWPTPTGDGDRYLLVRALAAIDDLPAAADAAGEPAGDPSAMSEASRALLWQACQIARARGDNTLAERLAHRVIESDRFAEAGYGVLVALHSPTGPLPSQPALAEVVRELRDVVPTSPLLRYLAAREYAQTGRVAEADARLRALAQDAPSDDSVLRALNEVWSQRAAREGMATLDDAEAFLADLGTTNPSTLAPPVALALLRLTRDRPAEAVGAVAAWLDRGLLVTADDRNRLRSLIDPLLRRATLTADSPARGALLGLWDRFDQAGVRLDRPMHEARIVLLSQRPPFDDAALLAAATRAADEVPAMDPGAFLAPVGRVVQGGRPDLGLALLKAGAARSVGLSAEATGRWAALIAQQGDADDLRDLFALTRDDAAIAGILRAMPATPDEIPADPARLRADVAYSLAAALRILDRPEEATEPFLALALELFPEHASSANDLGYQWADRGIRLDEAERLLEMARRLQPDEANVLDSLGWLRYKQGRLSDNVDATGAVVPGGEGAITLLQRASANQAQTAGPVTLDQLGDALWRAGRHDEALARWREALPRAQATVEAYQAADAPPRLLADASARLERITAKIAAVEAMAGGGAEPTIAPLGEAVSGAR